MKNKDHPAMPDASFASPITVLVGMGFPLKIRNIMDALRYLDGQPAVLRDEAFQATYDACRDALNGNAAVAEARDVLCALARRRGVLVDEVRTRRTRPASVGSSNSLNA